MEKRFLLKKYKCSICKEHYQGKRYISPLITAAIPLSKKRYICPSCYSKQLTKNRTKFKKLKPYCKRPSFAKKKFTKYLSNTRYTTMDIIRSHKASLSDKHSLSENFLVDICCVLTNEEVDIILKKLFKENIKGGNDGT